MGFCFRNEIDNEIDIMIQLRSLKLQLENLNILLDEAIGRGDVDEIRKIRNQIKEVEILVEKREEYLKRNQSPN